jgi:hypothetical protein
MKFSLTAHGEAETESRSTPAPNRNVCLATVLFAFFPIRPVSMSDKLL